MYDKKDDTAKPTVPNVDVGDILDIQATPEQEQKVIWKLDLVYIFISFVVPLPWAKKTRRIDSIDGYLLYDAIPG